MNKFAGRSISSLYGGVGAISLASLLLASTVSQPVWSFAQGRATKPQKGSSSAVRNNSAPVAVRAGAPMRRLSNMEYDYTIRDLTGIDLQPTKEFPVDGAAGEGFTNASEGLSDISPDLLTKYFDAAKQIAEHARFLPDGIRFSASRTRRDWTDESTARLRAFYTSCASSYACIDPDGKLQYAPYIAATVRHRADLQAGTTTLDKVATAEKLNLRYLTALWRLFARFSEDARSYPISELCERWQQLQPQDTGGLNQFNALIASWQNKLWQTVRVGSYIHEEGQGNTKHYTESKSRQLAVDPTSPPAPIPKERGVAGSEVQSKEGYATFRRYFPLFVCFPNVIPNDEVVSLKMFHREDQPLIDLFLSPDQALQLEHLWTEHRFLSRQPIAERDYLPLFIGFVSQDQPKEMLAYFESQKPVFQARAQEFEQELQAAIPKQWDTLLDFASRAYRRPLTASDKAQLRQLYDSVRAQGVAHEEAMRSVLARVLVSPAFLFRLETPSAGKQPVSINDWELATRLSYFLWASCPDAELRQLAATNRLHDPKVLRQQTARMIQDPRSRALAMEFGTQWINVRDFQGLKEKNERLFPTFDTTLRGAIYEETVLFFQSLFQQDRPLTDILDRDDTYLNETLAKHYGIPGVTGNEWRRVEGIHKYGRGGVLGLASFQAKESGASRTSPVLRGNWVSETLLGEKLPRPPANVPKLPEEEGSGGLTLKQQVERHSKVPACAICHQRIDPYGFALEHYDAIGRYRDKETTGQPVEVKATLKDGTAFEGIEGLRGYLLTKKRDVVSRLFCRRLLGYALGRSVVATDQPILEKMMRELALHGMRSSVAIQIIIDSPQFKTIQ